MVTRLTETETKRYLAGQYDIEKEGYVILNLPHQSVQDWTEDKRFAYLKKELSLYHAMKFACLRNYMSCQYIFVVNKTAVQRVQNFIDSLILKNNKPIASMPYDHKIIEHGDSLEPNGIYNACPLF